MTEEVRRRLRELEAQYGMACEQVSAILFAEDPIGINFGENSDEYEPEAGTILPRLPACQSVEDVRRVVHEEFVRWFDVGTAGPAATYDRIAERIWGEVLLEGLLGRRA